MDEPRPPAKAAPDLPDPKLVLRRRLIRAGIPVALLAVGLLGYGPILRFFVRQKAAGLGVELEFDDMERTAGGWKLEGARARLAGVRGLRARAMGVRVGTSWFSVTSVDADRVHVTVEGAVTERLPELAAWSKDHPDVYRLPGSGSDIHVEWRARADASPWLTLTGGFLQSTRKAGRFTAAAGTMAGAPMGQVSADWTVDASERIAIGVKDSHGGSLLTVAVRAGDDPPRAEIALGPIKLGALGAAAGLSISSPATASGKAELTLAGRGAGRTIDGHAELHLHGFLPPHPKELNGIVFGKETSIASKLHVGEDGARIDLSDLVVRAGRLELKGGGTVERAGDHAIAKIEIGGPISCAELAGSAAREDLGGALGGLVGEVARRAITGSAVVSVAIEADSRDLGAVKMHPKVGIGCSVNLPGFGK
jgi:hypothetical protein